MLFLEMKKIKDSKAPNGCGDDQKCNEHATCILSI
jgi:hypothetical protein